MMKKRSNISSLEYSFRATLANIVVANLLYSIVFILVQEPAAYGLFSDFFRSLSWWMGRVAIMQAVPLTLATGIFHVIIAANRMSALVYPIGHQKLWSQRRVNRILFVVWILTILECIPLIYPFEGNHTDFISPIRTVGVALTASGNLANIIYQTFAMAVGGVTELIAVSFYAFIGIRMSRLKTLPKSTTTATVSAVLVSTGGFMIVVVVLPDILATRLTGKAIWSDEMFYGLFKFANAYNNAIAPWVMLFYYRNIRNLILTKKLVEPKRNFTITMYAEPKRNGSI
ncbi:hypothetical protein PRIPAC_88168 [Pristionchus pacificus]|nr:hypothetical protein PRIPAC_88168 [Pristionchus pacificus]